MKKTIYLILLIFLLLNSCKGQVNRDTKLTEKTDEEVNSQSNKNVFYKKNNPEQADYNKYHKKLKGGEKWFCDTDYLRYLPVLKKEKIELILVPQDCGDFEYRYYLLSILENIIVSDLYVEGEWLESGTTKKEYYELTSFKITYDTLINIKKEIFENLKKVDVEELKYSISKQGKFEEIK